MKTILFQVYISKDPTQETDGKLTQQEEKVIETIYEGREAGLREVLKDDEAPKEIEIAQICYHSISRKKGEGLAAGGR